MFLSFKKQPIAGIDISDYSIEFLLLGKNKEILEYSRLELEKGIIENGKILNKEALIEKLKKILKRKNVKV
ncbi:pilus assembly protein PilM, partial [Patescibacteria group bacterium]|nr:pilus assembly protein PilM [Patescibacteria group bacterium]